MGEYDIAITEGELTAGSFLLRVDKVGAQPHFVFAAQGPEGMTKADIAAVLEGELTSAPAAVEFNRDHDLALRFYTGTQSGGTTQWVPVDLERDTYALIYFFPDQGDGLPHAFKGMYAVVEVAA